ncbi:MAG: UDP-4-amino-4,6-dideoxy-N-acetyl-beta-L-altrosamine transaminase [Afipia sp.]
MPRAFLGYGRQSIDESDIEAVVEVLRGDFLTQGPAVERFESALVDYTGAAYAVAVSSGTAALHIACLAAEVGGGDIGVTSAITFAASANCIRYSGGEVGFIDIDPATLGMSVRGLESTLAETPQTKVVIPVHMGGLADSASNLRKAAGERIVIEDAAHSFGGQYECGKRVGSCAYSDMTILSFHPVKAITTAEGGAVLTNDPELARRLRLYRSHGIHRDAARFVNSDAMEEGSAKPWYYEQSALGFNFRLTDIQAALGISQLAKLDRFISRRREIAKRYDEAFSRVPGIRLPQSAAEQRARSGLHLYIALFDLKALKVTRAMVMNRLKDMGVGSQVHYIPVYRQPYYATRYATDRSRYPEAERYYDECLSLPLHPGLRDEDVEYVARSVMSSLSAA